MSFNATTSKFSDYVRGLPTASEADLAAGNNMPIVSASDIKKMGGENVAKGSDVKSNSNAIQSIVGNLYALNFTSVVGSGDNVIKKLDLPIKAGSKVVIKVYSESDVFSRFLIRFKTINVYSWLGYVNNNIPVTFYPTTDVDAISYTQYSGVSGDIALEVLVYPNATTNADNSVDERACSFFENSVNLFNVNFSGNMLGYYGNSGLAAVNSLYNLSERIKVTPGTAYKLSTSSRFVEFFNAKGIYISSIQNSSSFTAGDGIHYARFSVAVAQWSSFMVVEGTSLPSSFVPYSRTIQQQFIPSIPASKIDGLPPQQSTEGLKQAVNLVGNNSLSGSIQSLVADNSLTISTAPQYIKKGESISSEMNFSTFGGVTIGKGGNGVYRSAYFVVDETNIVFKRYEASEISVSTKAHGLTIDKFLKVSLHHKQDGTWDVVLNSFSGFFKTNFTAGGAAYDSYGTPFIKAGIGNLTDVKISYCAEDIKRPLWVIGDSYTGVSTLRWPYQIQQMGFFNFLICGFPGASSGTMLADFQKIMNIGTPKYMLWACGMNDGTLDAYQTRYNQVKNLCDANGVTLILATIPTTSSHNKEAITSFVRSSGLRFVDFYKAVGASSSGIWYDGYLASDDVHPTELGAKALASQVLVDVPEVMEY